MERPISLLLESQQQSRSNQVDKEIKEPQQEPQQEPQLHRVLLVLRVRVHVNVCVLVQPVHSEA